MADPVLDFFSTDASSVGTQSNSNQTTQDSGRAATIAKPVVANIPSNLEVQVQEKAEKQAAVLASRIKIVRRWGPGFSPEERGTTVTVVATRTAPWAQTKEKSQALNLSDEAADALMKRSQLEAEATEPTPVDIEQFKRASTDAERQVQRDGARAVLEVEPTSEMKVDALNRDNSKTFRSISAPVLSVAQLQNISERSGLFDEVKGGAFAYVAFANGIETKANVKANLRLVPGTPSGSSVLSDFFLTNVTEGTREKVQWVQTFGSDYMFAYGKQPLVYSFSGVVYNTADKKWRNNMRSLYDSRYRATQLVRNKQRAVLAFEDVVVEGYLLNLDMNVSGQNSNAVPFSFSMYVIQEYRATDLGAAEVNQL